MLSIRGDAPAAGIWVMMRLINNSSATQRLYAQALWWAAQGRTDVGAVHNGTLPPCGPRLCPLFPRHTHAHAHSDSPPPPHAPPSLLPPPSCFLVGMSVLLSWLNYRGLTVVGHAVITSTIAIVLPFVLLCLLCIPHIKVRVRRMLIVAAAVVLQPTCRNCGSEARGWGGRGYA